MALKFINNYHDVVPDDWKLTNAECDYFGTISVSKENAVNIEYDTILQSNRIKYWINRIASSATQKILIRKRNFESLLDFFLLKKQELSSSAREALIYGKTYEPVARNKYIDVMKYCFNRDIVIQRNLFWLAASPDGLFSDKANDSALDCLKNNFHNLREFHSS